MGANVRRTWRSHPQKGGTTSKYAYLSFVRILKSLIINLKSSFVAHPSQASRFVLFPGYGSQPILGAHAERRNGESLSLDYFRPFAMISITCQYRLYAYFCTRGRGQFYYRKQIIRSIIHMFSGRGSVDHS